MRKANYLTNGLIVVLMFGATVCLSKNRVGKTDQVLLRKILAKNTVRDTLKLHSSATIHVIDEQLEAPTSLLDRNSKEELFNLFSKEKVEKVSDLPDSLVNFGAHPFLMGMWKAYQEHRPFVISPDVIWSLIEQGFARHITLNHEKYRNRLVGFEGKRELTIVVNKNDIAIGNPSSKWESVFPEFSEQIAKSTGKEYVKNLKADFSTTTKDSRLASEIILMESVKAYFDYRVMMIGCGISSVTIEGTVTDWEKIMKKMDYMDTFDMQSWTKELRPIIQQIINTKQGKIDKAFWSNMVQERKKELYAPHKTIDGWIIKFYPFDDKGVARKLEPIVNVERIAAEYVKVPFILEDREEKKQYAMEIWAGLFGMTQDSRNYTLKPEIGWAVVHQNESITQNLPTKDSYDIVSLKNIKELPESFFKMKRVSSLEISFLGQINIPDRLKEIKIDRLFIVGMIDSEGIERLKALFPNTTITINNKEVSSRVKINQWGAND